AEDAFLGLAIAHRGLLEIAVAHAPVAIDAEEHLHIPGEGLDAIATLSMAALERPLNEVREELFDLSLVDRAELLRHLRRRPGAAPLRIRRDGLLRVRRR